MKTNLQDTKDSLQNTINFAFPIDTHGTTNTVLMEQLGLSYDQAIAWLESLTPLFKTMRTGGLSHAEAWSRVLVYTNAPFEDTKAVRALSAEKDCGAMIWGSFCTAELLTEYIRLRFIQHLHVSSILALNSLQREGKSVNEAVADLQNEQKVVTKYTIQITTLQNDFKALKKDNPSLE